METPMPRKKPVSTTTPLVDTTDNAVPAVEVVVPVLADSPAETSYPEAHDLTAIYAAGLLPSNNAPATHTLQAVAADTTAGKPIAVLVDGTGEVLPAPIPYIASPSARPLYTKEEMDKYQLLYEEREHARVQELLHKNTRAAYDAAAIPPVEDDTPDDDLYGEPMSQAVAAAFPNLGKK
jgi:hypothetical protein